MTRGLEAVAQPKTGKNPAARLYEEPRSASLGLLLSRRARERQEGTMVKFLKVRVLSGCPLACAVVHCVCPPGRSPACDAPERLH